MSWPSEVETVTRRMAVEGALAPVVDAGSGFGDIALTFALEDLEVQLVRDRLLWSISARHPLWSSWFTADIWCACLYAQELPTPAPGFREQVDFFLESLEIVRARMRTEAEHLAVCLRKTQTDRALARLGLTEADIVD